MKSFIALATLSALSATPAMAGPYVNTEINSGWNGSDYQSSQTDLHVGYEGNAEQLGYYLQAGPAIVSVDGEDANTELSGKAGASFQATDCIGWSHYRDSSRGHPIFHDDSRGCRTGLAGRFDG